ncbi:hypothetical protein HK096_011395 [Nowakowskiella sp. JEL0078]|nr:hypothetical protein HK096_011395 [Nowakowskiella sp. JEL0078]
MAQTPVRSADFSPIANTDSDILTMADSALLLLGEFANHATQLLADEGWEILDDGLGWPRYVHEASNQRLRDPPILASLDNIDEETWIKSLLLELPCIVAPFVSRTSDSDQQVLVWPVKVHHHSLNEDSTFVSVLDLTEEPDEENEGFSETVTRVLILGEWKGQLAYRESELDLAYPQGTHLENWYSVTLAGISLIHPSPSQRILQIGLGGGTIPSFLSRHLNTSTTITCIEINRTVAKIAEQYFGIPCHPSLQTASDATVVQPAAFKPLQPMKVVVADALRWLAEAINREEKYDTIVLDVHTQNSFPQALRTQEFFKMCSKLLSKQTCSALVVNAGSAGEWAEILDLCAVFPFRNLMLDAKVSGTDEEESGVVVASFNEFVISKDLWDSRILDERIAEQVPFTLEDVKLKDDGVVLIRWGGNYNEVPELSEELRPKPSTTVKSDDPVWDLFD